MIYLLDTSGLVRLLGDPRLQEAWYDALDAEAIKLLAIAMSTRARFRWPA